MKGQREKTSHGVLSSIAVLIAFLVYYFAPFAHQIWILIACYLACLPHKETRLRYSFLVLLILILAILFTHLIIILAPPLNIFYIGFVAILLLINLVYYLKQPEVTNNYFHFLVLLFLILIGTQATFHQSRIEEDLISALIGVGIGYIVIATLSLTDVEKEFKNGVIPVLRALDNYAPILAKALFQTRSRTLRLNEEREALQLSLLSDEGQYPEWVYNLGFNPGLRAGLRFFLIYLERVTETFFSMDYLDSLRINMDKYSIERGNANLADLMFSGMQNNQLLIQILIGYFVKKKLEPFEEEFTDDIVALEKELKSELPASIELWEISADYIIIASFIRDIRDARLLLLQLLMSLPKEI